MYGILYQTMYDVYFDEDDLEVSTSIHIKETIQESDANQVFNASLRVIFWMWKVCILHTHIDMNNPTMLDEVLRRRILVEIDTFTW